YQSGWFATSKRTMTVDIDEIRVERAGDPSGDGELRMLFCIWNYATRKPIFTYKLPKGDHWANISDGHVETAILEKKVSIVSPPDYLGFFTECEDNDRWPFPMGLTGVLGEPALDESMTPFRQYENVTDWDTVKTLDIFHVPDANGAQGFKLTLDS